MPGYDRKLDPVTGDYIDDGAGGWEYVDTIETEVIHAVKDRRNQWDGDPSAGSDIHTLETANLGERDRLLAKRIMEVALQPFVDDGRARNLRVSVEINDEFNRFEVSASMTDVQNGGADLSILTPLTS